MFVIPLEWVKPLTVSHAEWAEWYDQVEVQSFFKANDALRGCPSLVKVVQFHVRIMDVDRFMRDEGLFEAFLISCQTLLFQWVDELELVDVEISHEARHELLQEFLKGCDVLSD